MQTPILFISLSRLTSGWDPKKVPTAACIIVYGDGVIFKRRLGEKEDCTEMAETVAEYKKDSEEAGVVLKVC
jgi:hypothetical protein